MKVALLLLAGIFLFCICQVIVESASIEKSADEPHEIVKRQSRRRVIGGNFADDDIYDDDIYDDDRYDDRYDDDIYDDDRYEDRYDDDRYDGGRRFRGFNRFNRRRRRRF